MKMIEKYKLKFNQAYNWIVLRNSVSLIPWMLVSFFPSVLLLELYHSADVSMINKGFDS